MNNTRTTATLCVGNGNHGKEEATKRKIKRRPDSRISLKEMHKPDVYNCSIITESAEERGRTIIY